MYTYSFFYSENKRLFFSKGRVGLETVISSGRNPLPPPNCCQSHQWFQCVLCNITGKRQYTSYQPSVINQAFQGLLVGSKNQIEILGPVSQGKKQKRMHERHPCKQISSSEGTTLDEVLFIQSSIIKQTGQIENKIRRQERNHEIILVSKTQALYGIHWKTVVDG